MAPIPGRRRPCSFTPRKRRENLYRCLVHRSSRTAARNQVGTRTDAMTASAAIHTASKEDGQRTCLYLTPGGLIGVGPPRGYSDAAVLRSMAWPPNVPRIRLVIGSVRQPNARTAR
jgi:hypothetical protein